jgi:hypothetical protein
MLIVVKLKTFSTAGWRPNVTGSKMTVPGIVRFNAPSAPVEPLLKAWV